MPSIQQTSESSPRSLIVSNVSFAMDEITLFNDLSSNYPSVKKVSRNYSQNGVELNSIRVDFESEVVVEKILHDDEIYIGNNAYYIRPYWPLICYRCKNEGHKSIDCPQQPVSEWRLSELLDEQKTYFDNLISRFENRWNTRLATVKVPSKNAFVDQLIPIASELTNACNQMNQQNIQLQNQLMNVAKNIQNMNKK